MTRTTERTRPGLRGSVAALLVLLVSMAPFVVIGPALAKTLQLISRVAPGARTAHAPSRHLSRAHVHLVGRLHVRPVTFRVVLAPAPVRRELPRAPRGRASRAHVPRRAARVPARRHAATPSRTATR